MVRFLKLLIYEIVHRSNVHRDTTADHLRMRLKAALRSTGEATAKTSNRQPENAQAETVGIRRDLIGAKG